MQYMLIDTSNVVKAAIYNGVDKEFGRKVMDEDGKPVQCNSAAYGFESAVHFLVSKMEQFSFAPRDLIFVVEGPNAKLLRTTISDTYKANRKGKTPDEVYAEVGKCEQMLLESFRTLGAKIVTQPAMEADDIIAYLAKELPSCLIVSTDGDMQQCISETASLLNRDKLNENRYGPFPTRYTTLYKALVGDTSDNIKGAKGFGDKAFLDLYCIYGEEGLDAMIELIEQRRLEELHEDVPNLKALQRIIDDREGVYTSWALAKLYPDKVNTWRRPLEWRSGVVLPATTDTDSALVPFTAKRKLVHAGNLDATLSWFGSVVGGLKHIALDIETSGSDESDDWLRAKKAKARDDAKLGVDVIGQELTGFSLTLGDNDQFSLYFTVDHVETDQHKNLRREDVVAVLSLIPQSVPILVHNASFELSVMHRYLEGSGYVGDHGFLPNVIDTSLMATYVDEEDSRGLKHLSAKHLGYTQVTYEEVTQGRRMNEMTAAETLAYGCDDTAASVGLYGLFRIICEIEKTWGVFLEVEQHPAYLTALAFNQGADVSLEKLRELEEADDKVYLEAETTLLAALVARGWEGTVCPQAASAADVTAAFIKDAYAIVTSLPREKEDRDEAGVEDAFLDTRVRTPEKLVAMLEASTEPICYEPLAACLSLALSGEVDQLNELLRLKFSGRPAFSTNSPRDRAKLLYEALGLPIRIRNMPSPGMRAKGIHEGTPSTDDTAIQWALQNDVAPGSEAAEILKALRAMVMVETRRKLYYVPYRNVHHWKTGRVHAQLIQNEAKTRRYSSRDPNLQQLPKHPKATGEPARFREVLVPHKKGAVIVSFDFVAQELRVITERSQDPEMLACYMGDDLKDMHSLTAGAILRKKALARRIEQLWTLCGNTGAPEGEQRESFAERVASWVAIDYAGFKALQDEAATKPLYKSLRALGKKTNFTTEYGAQAPKLAETLLVDTDEAQQYIDAKHQTFARAEQWKQEVIQQIHERGYALTMLGARRHLGAALRSGNKWEIRKAERQGVNFEIQGSSAEMTKLALARFWRSGLVFRYDCRFIAPVHDEVVFSVSLDCLLPFLAEAHSLMTANYAGMKVPILSSASIGPDFGRQTDINEDGVPLDFNRAIELAEQIVPGCSAVMLPVEKLAA